MDRCRWKKEKKITFEYSLLYRPFSRLSTLIWSIYLSIYFLSLSLKWPKAKIEKDYLYMVESKTHIDCVIRCVYEIEIDFRI